jgi:hypothetical protein
VTVHAATQEWLVKLLTLHGTANKHACGIKRGGELIVNRAVSSHLARYRTRPSDFDAASQNGWQDFEVKGRSTCCGYPERNERDAESEALQQEHSLGDEDHARRVGLRVNGLPVDCVGARAGSVCASGKQKSHPKVANYLFLVARGGIEPPTQGFSILCSTD